MPARDSCTVPTTPRKSPMVSARAVATPQSAPRRSDTAISPCSTRAGSENTRWSAVPLPSPSTSPLYCSRRRAARHAAAAAANGSRLNCTAAVAAVAAAACVDEPAPVRGACVGASISVAQMHFEHRPAESSGCGHTHAHNRPFLVLLVETKTRKVAGGHCSGRARGRSRSAAAAAQQTHLLCHSLIGNICRSFVNAIIRGSLLSNCKPRRAMDEAAAAA